MGNNNKLNASEMTSLVKQSAALQREDNNQIAQKEIDEKDVERKQQQKEALEQALPFSARNGMERTKRSKDEKIIDLLLSGLELFANSPIGSNYKVVAWTKILEAVSRRPRNDVFDTILKFFITNRDTEFLLQRNALQGIEGLDQLANLRIRVLYETMRTLAHYTEHPCAIATDQIRSIFNQNDLPNWVEMKMGAFKRARTR